MSWSQVSEPIGVSRRAATYRKDGLNWVWKDATGILGVSDVGGFLTVTATALQVERVIVGDFIYLTILHDHPLGISPFVEVTAVTATTITVDVPFENLVDPFNEIRFLFDAPFTLETGSSVADSPLKTIPFTIKPDKTAFYNLDAKRGVISRYEFDEPNLDIIYADSVAHRAYPDGETPPTLAIGLKQNVGEDITSPTMLWQGQENLITQLSGDFYETVLTTSAVNNITNGSTTNVLTFEGNNHTFIFATPIPDVNLAPVTLPAGMTLDFDGGGVNALGFSGTLTENFNSSFVVENNLSTITYDFDWVTIAGLTTSREVCEGNTFITWWDYTGGWKSYSYQNRKEFDIEAKAVIVADSLDDNFVSAYQNAFESIVLFARPESLTVLDYLNRSLLAIQIFEIIFDANGDIESYRRMFVKRPKGKSKTTPFKAIQNVFSIELTYSEKLLPANED